MSIAETLEILRTLQRVDRRMQSLEEGLAGLPKELDLVKEDQAAVKAKVDAADAGLSGILKKRRDVETEISKCEQNVLKYETDKLKVKTNTEFQAMNNQIAQEKEKQSGLEDQVLETFDEEEAAKAQLGKLKGDMALIDERVKDREAAIEKRTATDEEEVGRLRAEREALAPRLDAAMLRRYDKIREMKGGVAVAGVVRGSCAGCFSTLPPQVVAEVRKRDQIIACEQCGRYLAWDEIGATA